MKTLRAALVGLLAMLVWAGSGPSAFALDSTAAAALTASGGMSPGFSGPGFGGGATTQTVSFVGVATGLFTPSVTVVDVGSCTVSYTGTEDDTTVAGGTGAGTLTCTGTGILGHAVSMACSVSYVRVTFTLTMTGSCTGAVAGLLTLTAQVTPGQTPPNVITNFSLFGVGTVGAGAFSLTGAGIVTPGFGSFAGISDPATPQTVSYAGTAVGIFDTTVGSCALDGSGIGVHSFTDGGDTGTFTCSSGVITESCTYALLRVGTAYVVDGQCSGTATGLLAGAGVFVPSNFSPTTAFTLAGEFQIVPV